MRALSLKQAQRCETARQPTCTCRCHGLLHGKKRGIEDPEWGDPPDRAFFEALPADDPHHLPDATERRDRQKRARKQRELARLPRTNQLELFPEGGLP